MKVGKWPELVENGSIGLKTPAFGRNQGSLAVESVNG